MMTLQTEDGTVLTYAKWQDTLVGFHDWNGGLIIIDTKVYPLPDAEKLLQAIQTAIDNAKAEAGE
jgi:hypothetical protein